MDRVRFGRALGFGTRQAVKTLMTAVDAATAENPVAGKARASGTAGQTASSSVGDRPAAEVAAPRVSAGPVAKTAHSAATTVLKAGEAKRGLGRGSKRFGEAVWGPFVRLSGVLGLEVSGVFFGLFALIALGYLWKLRGAWHMDATNARSHHGLVSAAIMVAVFGYFAVTSFVRARRRERRR